MQDTIRVAPVLLAALCLGAAPAERGDDATLLRELRPAQRANLLFVQRDGSARVIAYQQDDAPFEVALATPEPQPAPAPAPPPRPRMLDTVVVHITHPRPAKPLALPPLPRVPLAAAPIRGPRFPELVAVRDGTLFVPTIPLPKPHLSAGPAPAQHDLAWLYAHRFDVAPSDRAQVPGVPVRSQVASPFDIDSGAFHGVRAQNGYSAVRVAVSIPCGISHFVTGPGYDEVTGQQGIVDLETGYIYVGGWGAGPNGVSVDAGLQKSSAQSEHDDYAFYWKYASNKPITSEQRFPCGGPDVVLELYPVSPSLLVFSATGVTDDGVRRTLTVVQQTRADDGWAPNGGGARDGIILKRIVSIAQPWSWHRRSGIGKRDRFSSGSYFGVTSPSDHTPRIVWSDCELGHVVPPAIVPTYHPWTSTQTWFATQPGVYTDWPPLDVMHRSDGACDATGISLHA